MPAHRTLSPANVSAIRTLLADGQSQLAVAKLFDVSATTIRRIAIGAIYADNGPAPAPAPLPLPGYVLWNDTAQAILPQLAGQIDCIITSPPYGTVRQYGGVGMGSWDFAAIAPLLANALTDGGVLVWIRTDTIEEYGYTGETARQQLAFQALGLTLHDVVYWAKSMALQRAPNRHAPAVETCLILSRGRPRTAAPLRDRPQTARKGKPAGTMGRQGDIRPAPARRINIEPVGVRNCIWPIATGFNHLTGPNENWNPSAHHPAVFPYRLAADFIRVYTLPGDSVLDPMAGSGTVIRAAVDLRRRAYGIEVVAEYCAAIRQRMAAMPLPLEG